MTRDQQVDASVKTEIGQSKLIDINEIIAGHSEKWFNVTLSRVNDSLVRLGVFEGEFHLHQHENEDELFYVVSGKLLLDVPGDTIELLPGQAYTVPRLVEHRTRAEERTVVLMVEGSTVKPTGDG
jgi:mannose-6-phosphate isomerase-like protein (cupin superfamily)